MTPERAKELLPIIQAYAEGKQIQWKDTDDNVAFKDVNEDVIWFDDYDYRVKPEKKVVWMNVYRVPGDADVFGAAHKTKEISDAFAGGNDLEFRIACLRIEYEEGEGLQ